MVNRRKSDLSALFIILIGILLLNVFSSFFFGRIDFTTDKRYTLSDISKHILANLKDEVQITVYLEGDFPAGFRKSTQGGSEITRRSLSAVA